MRALLATATLALALALSISAGLALSPNAAHAEIAFASQLPNVYNIPNNQTGCGLCHVNPYGDGPRNAFGLAAQAHISRSVVDWVAICALDPDGDGFTNGQEMGDPDCVWSRGQVEPAGEITDPRDPNSYPMTGVMPMGGAVGGEMMTAGVMGGAVGGEAMTAGVMGGAVGGEAMTAGVMGGVQMNAGAMGGAAEGGYTAAGAEVGPEAGAEVGAEGGSAAPTNADPTSANTSSADDGGCHASPSHSLPVFPAVALILGFFVLRARREDR